MPTILEGAARVTTAQYGPILAHEYYGGRTGVSPDDQWHYTDLGEMLVPQSFLDEAKAYHDTLPCRKTAAALPVITNVITDEPAWVADYNRTYTWDELLAGDGWQLHHTDRDGTRHWVRPGKNPREGSSATTGHNGVDKLHVFSSSIDWLPCDDSYSRWAYMVHRDFGGDFRAASRAIRNGAR
jgi:hypothetical protein